MDTINNKKKIKDVEPIENGGTTLTSENLQDFIEEPCLDACRRLYNLNIETTMSSANKKDVGSYGYINIALDSLSEENQQIILEMVKDEKNRDRFSFGTEHGSIPQKIISIRTPINEETTVDDVKECFDNIISRLKEQDVLYARFSLEEIAQNIIRYYGQDTEIDEELIEEMGYYYSDDENVYFRGEELLKKHLEYKNKNKNKNTEISLEDR
jgi:transcriptional regulator of heat shock response